MIVAVTNQKGGVGKTTTTVNLGAYLAREDKRVLLVDVDPQANATIALGQEEGAIDISLYEVLVEGEPFEHAVVPTVHPNLFLARATRRLAGAEVEMVPMMAREGRLARALKQAIAGYDLTIIDCPPSLGLLTVNALAAADAVVIPVQCEYLALEGLGQLIQTVSMVRDSLNPDLSILGVLLTMHDSRTNLSSQVVQDVRNHFPNLTFDTVIPRSIRLTEAPSFGKTILDYDPGSRGAVAYAALAREVAARIDYWDKGHGDGVTR
ncbi:MAG TPA: ParA family protein [Chloroflexota bacterium]